MLDGGFCVATSVAGLVVRTAGAVIDWVLYLPQHIEIILGYGRRFIKVPGCLP
jgi:hypothetical protein